MKNYQITYQNGWSDLECNKENESEFGNERNCKWFIDVSDKDDSQDQQSFHPYGTILQMNWKQHIRDQHHTCKQVILYSLQDKTNGHNH